MDKFFKKLKTGREGATLVTVVIATAFLIAIGVVILSASTKYIVSVYKDRNTNENLYDTEGILAEVRAGVLEYAGNAGKAAYQQVVENYEVKTEEVTDPLATPDPSGGIPTTTHTVSLKDKFAKLYICGIIDQLEGKSVENGITHPWPNIDESTANKVGDSIEIERKQFELDNLRCLTQVPEAIKQSSLVVTSTPDPSDPSATEPPASNGKIEYAVYKSPTKGYFLTIENLNIDYTDEAGYRSIIKTSIQLTAPDYKFDGDDTLDAASDYLSISDGNLKVDSGNTTNFDGNIYAGGNQDIGNMTDTSKDKVGVWIAPAAKAHFNSEKLVSRGDICAETGSTAEFYGAKNPLAGTTITPADPSATPSVVASDTVEGDIYVKNIVLKPSAAGLGTDPATGTHLSVKANTYVENDLDIRDSATTVTLGGKYIGYSYNENNSVAGTDKGKADYSSAILINGYSTSLLTDMNSDTGLKRLILAGRSFVSRKSSTGAVDGLDTGSPDIMMGESLAVRSNQVAYLVPERYVTVHHNPVSSTEAGDGTSDYAVASSLVDVEEMKNNTTLWKHLDDTQPVTGNYSQDGYVYLFLNFKNQFEANEYFKDFYLGNTQVQDTTTGDDADSEDDDIPADMTRNDLKDRSASYISSVDGGGLQISPALYLIAGNIINNYNADAGAGFQSQTYFDNLGNPSETLLTEGQKIGKNYVSLQRSLTTGMADTMRLDGSTAAPLVKGGMIYPDKIPNLSEASLLEDSTVVKVYSKSTTGDLTTSSCSLNANNRLLMLNKGSVTVDTACQGVIVADGDVKVNANFTGLIIATGSVITGNGVSMTSDPAMVKNVLTYALSSGDLHDVFSSITDPETHNATDIGECFRYLNWEKNTL